MEFEQDMDRLDQGLRKLKILYDQFFAGSLPRQPFELRTEMGHIVRQYSNVPLRKLSHRFQFNTLVGKYNSFSTLWNKQLRAQEAGRTLSGARIVSALPPEAAAPARAARQDTSTLAQVVLDAEDRDQGGLRRFFERYNEVRRSAGQPASGVSFEDFSRQLWHKAEAVKNRAGCDAVRLRLTEGEDGRIQLKAAPLQLRKARG